MEMQCIFEAENELGDTILAGLVLWRITQAMIQSANFMHFYTICYVPFGELFEKRGLTSDK